MWNAADEKSLKVIQHFVNATDLPTQDEGFGAIYHIQSIAKCERFVEKMAFS